jgi:hypothetical protein
MYKVFNKVWLGGALEFTIIFTLWIGCCVLLLRYNVGDRDFYVLDMFRLAGIICSVTCSCLHIFMWYYIAYSRLSSVLDLADLRIGHLGFNLMILVTTAGLLLFGNSSMNTFVYWWSGIAYSVVCFTWELFWIINKKENYPEGC